MTLVKFTPVRDLMVTQNRMNRIFDSVFGETWPRAAHEHTPWSPQIDVEETEDAIVIRADLPGMNKQDMKISVEDNRLTLSGHRKSAMNDAPRNFHRLERTCGSFCRSFSLPTAVLADKIEATYENGELEIVLPKADEVKPRQIQIR